MLSKKITVITIPKYEYVDIPLAEGIPMLNMGKMKKGKSIDVLLHDPVVRSRWEWYQSTARDLKTPKPM